MCCLPPCVILGIENVQIIVYCICPYYNAARHLLELFPQKQHATSNTSKLVRASPPTHSSVAKPGAQASSSIEVPFFLFLLYLVLVHVYVGRTWVLYCERSVVAIVAVAIVVFFLSSLLRLLLPFPHTTFDPEETLSIWCKGIRSSFAPECALVRSFAIVSRYDMHLYLVFKPIYGFANIYR